MYLSSIYLDQHFFPSFCSITYQDGQPLKISPLFKTLDMVEVMPYLLDSLTMSPCASSVIYSEK